MSANERPSFLKPRVTVAICTLDRAEDLRVCIASLLRQTALSDSYEVLVVDNGASAEIAEIVREHQGRGPTVRYAQEQRRGLTYARRRAWKGAEGTIVSFLDDDAVAHPDWVSAVIDAFESGGPATAIVGGPVHDVRGLTEPWPFTDSPGDRGLDLGQHRREVAPHENLWGCNIAIGRDFLLAVDGFGEPLGHRDGHPGANEDIIIQRQADRAGFMRLFDPQMQIVHNSWRATASTAQRNRLAFYVGADNAMMERLLGANSWGQRSSAIKLQLARLRGQLAAWYRFRKGHQMEEAAQAQAAALQTLGTVYGWSWPPSKPQSKPDDT